MWWNRWIIDIKRKLADWVLKNTTFPNNCKTGNELSWMLKDNCPICVSERIEYLSNAEYHRKYPARNRIQMGVITIYLCDYHLNELREVLNKVIEC